MELLVEVAPVSGDLVEDQRQPERQLLVLEAGVGGEDGLAAQGGGCLLDDSTVGAQLLVVRHGFPRFGLSGRPREAGPSSLGQCLLGGRRVLTATTTAAATPPTAQPMRASTALPATIAAWWTSPRPTRRAPVLAELLGERPCGAGR